MATAQQTVSKSTARVAEQWVVLRVNSANVHQVWPLVQDALIASMGASTREGPKHLETSQSSMNKMRLALMNGQGHVWLLTRLTSNDSPETYAVAVTTIWSDMFTGTRSLALIALKALKSGTPVGEWKNCMKALKEFALKIDCGRIVIFTEQQRLARLAKYLGATIEGQQTVLVIEAEERSENGKL